jgi:hypothetical protein
MTNNDVKVSIHAWTIRGSERLSGRIAWRRQRHYIAPHRIL